MNLFYHGIIHKYWPNIDIKIINNTKKSNNYNKIEDIIYSSNKIMNLIEDTYDEKKIPCELYLYKILKIDIYDNINNNVNIIKLFADIELNHSIPFIKLVLENYENSYYKLFKHSIFESKLITHKILKHWIRDFTKNDLLGYNKYIYSKDVLIIKLFIIHNNINYYNSLIFHINGKIEFTETLLSYKWKSDWIPNQVQKMLDTMNSDTLPESHKSCMNCAYANQYNLALKKII